MNDMYSLAEFAPLSKLSLHKLMKGQAVRVQHGHGLKLHLSKVQHKKHKSSMMKGKGYNLTFDPYQSQLHGQGFFEDLGRSFATNIGKPLASGLIHQGIPMTLGALGGMAGSLPGSISFNPVVAGLGGMAGEQLGNYAGTKLADYVGSKTGYGLSDVLKAIAPHAKKAMIHVGKELGKKALSKALEYAEQKALERGVSPEIIHHSKKVAHHVASGHPIDEEHSVREVIEGGLKHHPHYAKVHQKMNEMFGHGRMLIDEPFTARQAVDMGGQFLKNPAGTMGFGLKHKRKAKKGGTLLIDQPFTAREAVDMGGQFFKNPAGTMGFGLKHKRKAKKGGTLLIDEPITTRQIVDNAGRFFKNPAGSLGFGLKKHRHLHGSALMAAGY